MEVIDFALNILRSGHLEDKFYFPESFEFNKVCVEGEFFRLPGRDQKIELTNKQVRFPKGHFHLNQKKAQALNSFANHELLAIEMMAQALLVYPHDTDELIRFKRGVISTIKDEQLHCRLYIERMNEIGFEFGDFALNDYFWTQMHKLKTPSQFMSVMSLTFEAANLDFASFYYDVFKKIEDEKTASILKLVLEDEIKHVNLGAHYLNLWRKDKSLWEYYLEQLPWPLTPARSKGQIYVKDLRIQATLDHDFLTNLDNFQSKFKVTNRKQWKTSE